jgi:hypothetical protein
MVKKLRCLTPTPQGCQDTPFHRQGHRQRGGRGIHGSGVRKGAIIVRDPSNENAAGAPCAFARACFFNNPRNEYPLMSWNEQNVLGLRPFRLHLGPFKSPSPVLGEERLRDERTFHNDTSISPSMAHTIDFNKPFPKLFVPYQNSQRGTRKSELCSDGIFQIA